ALRTLRTAAREAMTELRATVAVLRGGDDTPLPPSPGLHDLDGLVQTARSGGVDVQLRTSGEERALPVAVDVTAFRVVQEALTNVVRHAGASVATVSIRYEPAALFVTVDDDGRGSTSDLPAGHGLVGIRERAEALGGAAHLGPAPGGGFRVQVRLPTERVTP
ncbi:MAG: sensor histidine kinase, partial [Actinomycetota bacterium]